VKRVILGSGKGAFTQSYAEASGIIKPHFVDRKPLLAPWNIVQSSWMVKKISGADEVFRIMIHCIIS
jgi:hypothetical protein